MMDQLTFMFTESVVKTIPTMFVVTFAILMIKGILSSYLKQKNNYREDKYRLEIEKKLFDLNANILKGQERFNKVNHLILEGNEIHASGFLESMGVNKNVKEKENSVFVLTPFHPEFDNSFQWVKDFFSEHGYSCSRGDDIHAESNILSHILSEMLASEIVVANISGRNPNVFYELGIAHALGKQVVLIAQNTKDITFDVSGAQVVIYQDEVTLKTSLGKWLVSTLRKNKLTSAST